MSHRSGPFAINQSLHEALLLHRQGRLQEAEKIYRHVLKAAPDNFDAVNLLGAIKAQLGQMSEAHRLFAAAVKANPRVPQAWLNLGQALLALKRGTEALDCFDKALALAPAEVEALNGRANVLLSLGRPREALEGFRQVLARAPQHAEARLNSGIAHAALGAFAEALAEFDRAVALAPGHPVAHFNRGLALYEVGRYAEAADAHARALQAAPQHGGAWLNRGRALAALNAYDEAITCYRRTLTLRGDDADAHFMESLALLTRGAYRDGFQKYEWRWRRTGMPAQAERDRPLWLGDAPLEGKTVFVHAEQGLGDTIQFARYVPMLAARGAKVVLEVPRELASVMARLDGAAAIVVRDAPPPAYDMHCPLGSLPLAFKTEFESVPAPIPYLAADEQHLQKWSHPIGGLERPRVAIAWAGNPNHLNDRNRSIGFARLAPLLAAPARFVGIQRDLRSDEAAAVAGEPRLTYVGAALDDFADTAAVIALADLVISVDTAVAHLAGAMGRPLWVLLPFAPDWRWTLAGDMTPWYPTARLFRQPALGDWDSVIARVAAALQQYVAEA